MFRHIVRRAFNVFDPPPIIGVESLGIAPPQRSENERFQAFSLRFRTKYIYCGWMLMLRVCCPLDTNY